MCRLLGVVAASPAPIAALVPEELPRFEALAAIHHHGWGVAHVADGAVAVRKEPGRAGTSPAWRPTVDGTHTDAALLHLRQATPGMSHTIANTHPFQADGLAFAHNGNAHPVATLDALVAATGAPRPLGDTDSERYFSLLRAATGRPVSEGLLDAAARIAAATTATSLNALVLTEQELVAVAWWHEPVIVAAGYGETDRDYRLWYRVTQDRVVIASAFVAGDGPEWQELPHGHALSVHRGTLAVRINAVQDTRPAA